MSFFDDLQRNVKRMGKPARALRLDIESPPVVGISLIESLSAGIDIKLEDLESSDDYGGLLGYHGAQVLLYIREHEDQLAGKLSPDNGPRFHVADCATLRRMRSENRYDRYVVTNDVSGLFELRGRIKYQNTARRVPLHVCKNCLKYLNYQGYRLEHDTKTEIFRSFNLAVFFSTYSSVFRELPRSENLIRPFVDPELTKIALDNQTHTLSCQSCMADLPVSSGLLAMSKDEDAGKQKIVCADCRRKAIDPEPVALTNREMNEISVARASLWQNRVPLQSDEVRCYADSAFHGYLKVLERDGYTPPEPGIELLDSDGRVFLELGLAWSASKHAVVLHEKEADMAREQGWQVLTLAEAMLESQQDGW